MQMSVKFAARGRRWSRAVRVREWEPEAEGWGFLPREITLSRDHLRSSAANFTQVCMTSFASRCVSYFTRWGDGNWQLEWLQLLLRSGWWAGRGVEDPAGVRGTAPVGLRGEAPWGGGGDCHETNLKCFMNKFCYETFFFSFCYSMNSLYTCSYRCRDFAGNNLLPMILSASAFNSCVIKFSILNFNESIIKNIISLVLSFSKTERRDVVFCTQWFIGQYHWSI